MRKIPILLAMLWASSADAQVLPLREQAKVVNEILADRFDNLLPVLMDKTGIDMWVLISREYNEDPVLRTMLPAEWLSARRRTILVFYRDAANNKYEKLAIARYNVGESIKASWDLTKFPNQWDALADIIQTRKPKKIGINTSVHHAHADGLDHTDYAEMMEKIPAAYKNKVVSAEDLAIRWLETRTAREMAIYPQLVDITHSIIEEGFSEKVITPGITTTDDLVWWFREKIRGLGLETWFHPSVSVQRNDPQSFEHLRNFSNRPKDDVIQPGDLLHVDIGITYLRLNTDIQQHAYVLKPGEQELPSSIKKAFERSNRLQDILTSQFKEGKSGNTILADALAQAKREGIVASIYTHPLGFHGHAAGPTIGLWDQQNGVPGAGDYPLHNGTAYSIELNTATEIPEWKKTIRIMLEQDGYFDESGFRYINGRQKEVYLVPRPKAGIGD
ncbi:aminopeptidase P family protein [Flavihumibacter rivuli]|uniref:M24 family metallopeptidase n=1 Tax=Flavihumibacter rivuli TaxID=2838156 RepID=UPI001BDF638D|nr:M24 family metallopeptidase [Flavihumibacter rivuli]ULQ55687.1 aminopeptidase P family protein [Flavihumibacter rivuli]